MIIYRGDYEFINIDVDDSTVYKNQLLGEDVITSNFILEFYHELKIGDYVYWNNKKYTIFKQPDVTKNKTNEIKYSVEFGGDQYRLINALFLLDGENDFFLLGDIQKFADLIISNLNRIAGLDYYSLGEVAQSETLNLNFKNTNCLATLQQVCREFGKEFVFSNDGTTLDIVDKLGVETTLEFQFKEGLRNIQRVKISDKDLVTRLYPYGSDRNITADYGGKKLKINPLESNIDKFGIIEGVQEFSDIYPRRLGSVTSIGSDEFTFTDLNIDFDVNEQLMPGVIAKIVFNTGNLSGYELEILSFDSTTKTFKINTYEDENGFIIPNSVLNPSVGDEYILFDIIMPQTYIDNAETELLEKATEYLQENSNPNVIYNIVPHYPYLRDNLISLSVGDIVTVVDDDFDISYRTRILSLTQSLSNPYLYTIKTGDKVTVNYITKVLSNQLDTDNNITIERNDRTVQYNRVRRNLKNIDELRDSLFDTDGYFDTDNIRPLSIETSMVSVGNKSQQFMISNLLIEANLNGNPNVTNIGSSVLAHFTIEDEVREWNLTGSIKSHSDPNQFYYIYARCIRDGSTGDYLTSSQQFKTDTGTTYYYFLVGVIHSEQDNVRGVSLTYGQTTINGKFITTGRVQSLDGFNYFDLDNAQFFIGDGNTSLDWNVTNPDKLTLKGAIIQNSQGQELTIPNYKGAYSSSTTYQKNETVRYNGSIYILEANTSVNRLPTDTNYWGLYVESGEDGATGATGATGVTGATGSQGVSLNYTGAHNTSTSYRNNGNIRSVVVRNGVYYAYIGTDNRSGSFVSSQWINFGANFESIATGVLFAENANIADWIIKNGRITSQDDTTTLYGTRGKIHLNGSSNGLYDDTTRIEGDLAHVTGMGEGVFLNPNTVFDANGSPNNSPRGSAAVISGKCFGQGTSSVNRAGVHGLSLYDDENNFGGLFTSIKSLIRSELRGDILLYGGVHKIVRTVTSSTALNDSDYMISCSNSSTITIFLPLNPKTGREIKIRRNTSSTVFLNSNGDGIYVSSIVNIHNIGNTNGWLATLIYTGGVWLYNEQRFA